MTSAVEALFWLSLNVFFESQGESLAGKVGVAHVTINRANERGLSVKEVVTQPKQFSWYDSGKIPPIKHPLAFMECIKAVQIALSERLEGKTLQGANHYYAHTGDNAIPPPWWAKKMKHIKSIGNHLFLKD